MFDFAQKRPFDIPLVVLDTETTGLYPAMGHRIVEIGAVRYEQGEEVAQLSRLLNPKRKMDADASRVNGITDAQLIGQPTFADITDELLALLDGALLVAHNASFDAGFLGMEFYIQGVQTNQSAVQLANPWLCTLQLARAYFRFGRNNLQAIAHHLGVQVSQAHRALADVYTTAEVFRQMVTELSRQRIKTVDDLLYAQGHPIFAPHYKDVVVKDKTIDAALRNGRSLHITYQSNRGTSHRKITPLYPTQHKNSRYLVAYCHISNDQRTFKLDRIVEVKLSET